jgi:hypothetical protein
MIDGHFFDLKNELKNHNGLIPIKKIKFIIEFPKALGHPKRREACL